MFTNLRVVKLMGWCGVEEAWFVAGSDKYGDLYLTKAPVDKGYQYNDTVIRDGKRFGARVAGDHCTVPFEKFCGFDTEQAAKDFLFKYLEQQRPIALGDFKQEMNSLREVIGNHVADLRRDMNHQFFDVPENQGQQHSETRSNIMLALRHLEDARMRLGKAIQAADGGVSIYDK